MELINTRIKHEICYNTILAISNDILIDEYKQCKSVKNEITKLEHILNKYTNETIKQQIIQEYILELIPAGTKGVVRGNKFNNIVKEYIINIGLDNEKFDICFEKKT